MARFLLAMALVLQVTNAIAQRMYLYWRLLYACCYCK